MRENKLQGHTFVRFGIDDEDDYVIICQFSYANTSQSPEWLQLQRKFVRSGKTRGETAQTKATAFISDNHILSQLVKQPQRNRENSRFHIDFNIREKVFVIQLFPSFERLVTLDELKDADAGIYRLISNGEVVYIGKGMIKQHRADKEFDKIEVSFVPLQEKQLEYESFHIDRYKKSYGRLPMYNRIAGHTISSGTSR